MICKDGSGQDAVLGFDKTDFDIGVRRQRRKIEHRFALVLDVEAKRDPEPTHEYPTDLQPAHPIRLQRLPGSICDG